MRWYKPCLYGNKLVRALRTAKALIYFEQCSRDWCSWLTFHMSSSRMASNVCLCVYVYVCVCVLDQSSTDPSAQMRGEHTLLCSRSWQHLKQMQLCVHFSEWVWLGCGTSRGAEVSLSWIRGLHPCRQIGKWIINSTKSACVVKTPFKTHTSSDSVLPISPGSYFILFAFVQIFYQKSQCLMKTKQNIILHY